MAEGYVCTLNEAELKKAKKELGEDPKQRDGAVQTLRDWVNQQPHLTCDTSNYKFLLRFLRIGKFSQLAARERLENYLQCFHKMPEFLRDIDTHDPKIQKVLKAGTIFSLGTNKDGVTVLCNQAQNIDPDFKEYSKVDMMRAQMALMIALTSDENITVNGFIFFCDLTGFTMKHQMIWSMDDIRKIMQIWQKGFPARYKKIIYYNGNSFFEAMFQIFSSLMSKKLRDRILMESNLEKIYKLVPKDMMIEPFLPDEHKGPRQAKDIIAKQKEYLMSEEVRKLVLYETGSKFGYDPALKRDDIPQESFRKLNVD